MPVQMELPWKWEAKKMARDERGRSDPPKTAGEVARTLTAEIAPDTPLGSVQSVWQTVVGEAIAAVTTILAEREGELEVGCESAVWADELAMMEPQIRARLNAALPSEQVESIKFRTGS